MRNSSMRKTAVAASIVIVAAAAIVMLRMGARPPSASPPAEETVAARARVVEPDPVVAPDADPERELTESPTPTPTVEEIEQPDPQVEVTLGDAFVLRVIDRVSKLDLTAVEVHVISNGRMSASWSLPAPSCRQVAHDVASPMTVQTVIEGDGRAAAGFDIRDAGEVHERTTFGRPVYLSRGLAVYARRPGYAWGRVEVDVTAGGERIVELERSASLTVRLENLQLDRYRELELSPLLWLRRTDVPQAQRDVSRVSIGDSHRTRPISFAGLEPGTYELRFQLGDRFKLREPPVLGHYAFPIAAEERREQTVLLDDPPIGGGTAELTGTLHFPPFPTAETIAVRFFDLDKTHRAVHEIPLSEMTPIGGTSYAWDAGSLPVGSYQIKIWPLLVSFLVDLPATGKRDVELRMDRLAEVEVEVVDAVTRERVGLPELFWSHRSSLAGLVNHIGIRLPAGPEVGLFRIHSVPGELYVSMSDPPDDFAYGYATQDFEVAAGFQRVQLELSPICAIRIRLVEGETRLPRSFFDAIQVRARQVDGEGRVTMDATRTEGVLNVSLPGDYRVSLRDLPDDYLPADPQTIRVVGGEMAEVTFDLKRRL